MFTQDDQNETKVSIFYKFIDDMIICPDLFILNFADRVVIPPALNGAA